MKRFLHAGEGYALFQRSNLQTALHQTDKIVTDNIRLYSSTTQERYGSLVRPWFRQAAGLMPVALVCFRAGMGRAISRLLTGISSALSRSPLEAESKPTRRIVEAESNNCRRTVEQVSNKSRRNRVSCNVFSIRTSCIYLGHFFMCLQAAIAKELAPETDRAVLVADSIQPLQIGDTIPDYLWDLPLQVVNHPEGKDVITLSDYKGKLIILDFWATWCSGCMETLPKVAAYNADYNEYVQILPVNSLFTKDNLSKIQESFLVLNERLNTEERFYSICNDEVFYTLFKPQIIPHLVWIDPSGRVLTQTYSSDLNRANIENYIAGISPDFTLKNDHHIVDHAVSLSSQIDLGSSGRKFQSIFFTNYIEGLPSDLGRWFETDHGFIFRVQNASLNSLYRLAFGSNRLKDHYNPQYFKFSFDVDSGFRSGFLQLVNDLSDNYCFELQVAEKISQEEINHILRYYLATYFGVVPHQEVFDLKLLQIEGDPVKLGLITKYSFTEFRLDPESTHRYMRRVKLPSLFDFLNLSSGLHFEYPGVTDLFFDFEIPSDLDVKNPESVMDYLKSLGFTVHQVVRSIDGIVFNNLKI